jgi:hypothetical protein
MDRGRITSGGEKKHPFCHCYQRGRINSKTQLRLKIRSFYFVAINAKGGECWIFGVFIDVKRGSIWY